MFLRINEIQKRREKLIVPAFLVYYPPMIRKKSVHHLSHINLFKQRQKIVKCYDCIKRIKKYLVYILNISTDSQLGCTNYAFENAYFSALLFLLKGKVL